MRCRQRSQFSGNRELCQMACLWTWPRREGIFLGQWMVLRGVSAHHGGAWRLLWAHHGEV